MMIVVTGGAASGKSKLAEEILNMMQGKRYYVATMHKGHDEETLKKIERHVKMREKKGFITVECEYNLSDAAVMVENVQESAVMVECMSNLLANEMYLAGREDVINHVVEQVTRLCECCKNLIIVTNEVSLDGVKYDDSTMEYIRNLQGINGKLGDMADYVMESVFGIPVMIKGNMEDLRREGYFEAS